jgi:hypothetical protein
VPGFPPLLEAALLWALQKPPERRPATAGELAAAVREGRERPPTIGAYTEEGRSGPAAAPAAAPDAAGGAREPARRPPRWRLPLAVIVAAVLVAVAVVGFLGRSAPPGPPPLAVTGVTASTDPPDGAGRCPHAAVTLRATVATNGAPGTISYEWLRPDGRTAGAGRVVLRAGERSATVSLAVSYDGGTAAQGVAALHVVSPVDAYSAPLRVSYSCP